MNSPLHTEKNLQSQDSTTEFNESPKQIQPVCFHEVPYEKVKTFMDKAFVHLLKKQKHYQNSHDKYGHELPKIVVTPVPEHLKKKAKISNQDLIDSNQNLSPQLQKKLETEYSQKIKKITKEYEEKIKILQSKITELHTQLQTVASHVAQLEEEKKRKLAQGESIQDIQTELARLEHKISVLVHKEEKYAELAQRLFDAKSRIDIIKAEEI
jgi:DNA repair exonuclease SbcCD ATPase subunit